MEKLLQFDIRKNIFLGAIIAIGFCVSLYIYSVTTMVRNIVTLKQLSMQILDKNEKISSMFPQILKLMVQSKVYEYPN